MLYFFVISDVKEYFFYFGIFFNIYFFFFIFLDCLRESRVFNIILNKNGLFFVIGVFKCGEFGNG